MSLHSSLDMASSQLSASTVVWARTAGTVPIARADTIETAAKSVRVGMAGPPFSPKGGIKPTRVQVRWLRSRLTSGPCYRPGGCLLGRTARGGAYCFGGGKGSWVGSGLSFENTPLGVRTRARTGNVVLDDVVKSPVRAALLPRLG